MGHPELRVLLEKIIPEQGEIKGHEVEHEFPGLGQRTMRLNARQVFYEGGSHATILLSIEDVTDRRILEREKDVLLREKDQLLQEKDVLFEELQHRISNSLQVIASIILLKARTVQSEETRLHLQDTHKRVMSVAAVQEQLHVLGTVGSIEIAPYLSKLCDALAISMIGDSRPITLKVVGAEGTATSRQAESIGLIVTELVMNALKHAFPDEKLVGEINVTYDRAGTNWKLTVSDNGIGRHDGTFAQKKVGLGTGIIKALHISSMPKLKHWPALGARSCRSPTPLTRRGSCLDSGRVLWRLDDSREIYSSIYLSWHWCGALRWGN